MAAAFGFLWLIGRVIYSLGYYTGKPNNRLAGSLVRNVHAASLTQRQIMFFIADRPGFCRVSSGHHDILTMWTVRKVVGHSPGVLKSHSSIIWTQFTDRNNTHKLKYSQSQILKSKRGSKQGFTVDEISASALNHWQMKLLTWQWYCDFLSSCTAASNKQWMTWS